MFKALTAGVLGEQRIYFNRSTRQVGYRLSSLVEESKDLTLRLCPEFFKRYLASKPVGDLSPIESIFRVPPRHVLSDEGDTLAAVPIDAFGETPKQPFPDLIKDILVSSCDLKSKEISIALDGGIDSWCLALLAKRLELKVRCFTLKTNIPGYCEWPAAKKFAEKYDIPCAAIETTADRFFESLDEFVRVTEQPIYNLHPVSKLILAKELRDRDVTRIHSGDGAREVLSDSWDSTMFPLTVACFSYAGVDLVTPFASNEVAAFSAEFGPFQEKEPIKSLAHSLEMEQPERPESEFPGELILEKIKLSPLESLTAEPALPAVACVSHTARILLRHLGRYSVTTESKETSDIPV